MEFVQLDEIEKPDILKPRGGLWVKVGDCEVHIGTEYGIDREATKHIWLMRFRISLFGNHVSLVRALRFRTQILSQASNASNFGIPSEIEWK